MENPEIGPSQEETARLYRSVEDVKRDFKWVEGNPKYPTVTAKEAWKHIEDYIPGNEFVSERELVEEFGFVKKDAEVES